MPINNIQADSAKPKDKPYRLNDGGGLQLEVRPSGAKVWLYRYRNPLTSKQNIFTLGRYPKITIRQARILLEETKSLIDAGLDPNREKRLTKLGGGGDSFEVVAMEWHANQQARWSQARWSQANSDQVLASLRKDVFPFIGALPMNSLLAPDLLQVLRRVEARGL